jgi:hypothetical protein
MGTSRQDRADLLGREIAWSVLKIMLSWKAEKAVLAEAWVSSST